MQINAINPNFTGRRDNIDAYINLDDNSLRQIAKIQSTNPKRDKQQKIKNNLLISAVPIAAGLAAATKFPALFSKTGRLEKLMQFGETSLKWFAAFGIIDLVGGGINKLRQKSEKVREFANNHQLLSLIGTIGVSLLAVHGAHKGFGKIADKFLPKYINKYDKVITDTLVKWGEKLDNNNILNTISKKASNLNSRTPEFFKHFVDLFKHMGKGFLEWSPVILGFGALLNSTNYASKKANEVNAKYADLKEKQIQLAQARNRELQVQRDFLLTNPSNADDLSAIY